MAKRKVVKWYEDAFLAVLLLSLGLTIWFNGFSYVADQFLTEEELTSPTKSKALLSIVAWLETTSWKYVIVCFFFLSSFLAGITGFKKYRSNDSQKFKEY